QEAAHNRDPGHHRTRPHSNRLSNPGSRASTAHPHNPSNRATGSSPVSRPLQVDRHNRIPVHPRTRPNPNSLSNPGSRASTAHPHNPVTALLQGLSPLMASTNSPDSRDTEPPGTHPSSPRVNNSPTVSLHSPGSTVSSPRNPDSTVSRASTAHPHSQGSTVSSLRIRVTTVNPRPRSRVAATKCWWQCSPTCPASSSPTSDGSRRWRSTSPSATNHNSCATTPPKRRISSSRC